MVRCVIMYRQTKKQNKHGYLSENTNPGSFFADYIYMAISTLLAGSTRVSTRVTRQERLTRLDYFFFSFKRLQTFDCKRVTLCGNSIRVRCQPGSCKEAPSFQLCSLSVLTLTYMHFRLFKLLAPEFRLRPA